MATCKCVVEVKVKQRDQFKITYTRVSGTQVDAMRPIDDLTTKLLQRFDYWIEYEKLNEKSDLQLVGEYLYDILFPNLSEIRREFEADYDMVHRLGDRLLVTLVFRKEAEELAKYPWEFLHMPARPREGEKPKRDGFFLAGQQTDLILTRFVPDVNPQLERAKQLRILLVFSHPYMPNWADIDTDETRSAIKVIEDLRTRNDSVQVRTLPNPTWQELFDAINTPPRPGEEAFKPHILHFIGHGDRVKGLALKIDAGGMALRKENRNLDESQWHNNESISDLFTDSPPRLVFLQACETAKKASGEAGRDEKGMLLSDLASTLVNTKIAAVVAMQYSIKTKDAAAFAQKFYRELSQGVDVDEAVRRARQFLGAPEYDNKGTWSDRRFGTPVLYLQSEKAIVEMPPAPPADTIYQDKKFPCPNPKCDGRPLFGDTTCVLCQHEIAMCPECLKKNDPRWIDLANGLCGKCRYRTGERPTTVVTAVPSSQGASDDAVAVAKPKMQQTAAAGIAAH